MIGEKCPKPEFKLQETFKNHCITWNFCRCPAGDSPAILRLFVDRSF